MLLAAAVSAACQTDVADGTQSVADGYVRFSSGEITQTRTVVGKEEEALTVAWDAGDLVGIYGSAEAGVWETISPMKFRRSTKRTEPAFSAA